MDRPTPKLPPLHKIDEAFFVNDPKPVAPEPLSDDGSKTSKAEEYSDDSDVNLMAPAGEDYVSPSSDEESSGDQSSSSDSSEDQAPPSKVPRVTASA